MFVEVINDDTNKQIEGKEGSENDEKDKVETSHAKVKDVTDQLKHDFINKLALELPKSSAGDND